VTLGERNQRDAAQDLSTHLGKLIRIKPDGSIPADNPFVQRPGARPEIWSYGHRNMQGAALNPRTGRLWTHEHGARGGDEINIPAPGRNYGWPVITHGVDYSGFPIGIGNAAPGMEQPVHYWRGSLFVGGLAAERLVRLELDGDRVVKEHRYLAELDERIRDVRVGPDGMLYLLEDNSDARILRVEPLRTPNN